MNENEVMRLMDNITYGWVDKNAKKHINDFDKFSDDYILQSPEDVVKSKVGVCWDQVELERYYFKDYNDIIKTFFIVHFDNDKCPSHTFLTFKKGSNYFWFEHSWEKFRGIHKYDTLSALLKDVKEKFIHFELNDNYTKENLVIHEYIEPKYNISVQEFYNHCDKGKFIDI